MAHLSDVVAQEIMGEISDIVARIEAVAEKVPRAENLQIVVSNVLEDFKRTAGMTVMGETSRMKAELAKAAADIAGKVAKDVAGREKSQWIAGCFVVVGIILGFLTWSMYSKGYSAGYGSGQATGYIDARDEKAAASWANTPDGKMAYRLAAAGNISMLALCEKKYGWKIEDDYCKPFPTYNEKGQEVIFGWKIR